MIDQLNAELPKGHHFSHLGWWPGKAMSFFGEYDRRFPHSPLRRRLFLLKVAGAISVLALFAVLYPVLRHL